MSGISAVRQGGAQGFGLWPIVSFILATAFAITEENVHEQ